MNDPIAVGGGFGVVSNHDDGLTELLIELAKHAEDVFRGRGIEVTGGLVGKKDLGLGDDGAGDGHALLLAAGELRRLVLQAFLQAEETDYHVETVRVKAVPVDVLGESDIVAGVEGGEEIVFLEDKTDFVAAQEGSRRVAHGGEIVAVEQDAASGGLSEAADDVEHGGLAATRRPHDGDEAAGWDLEIDAAKRGNIDLTGSIDFPQAFGLEYRLQSRLPKN